eukprot:TRINITY_DN1713_c0_g1_i4.p2 TRINITY_DN1713_c0_g1~~TRINITY_DN1713_c0_g1_i4.p2  ORF type:complete len:198 (-),score=18.73 TRINITY_DN1713_c0_g1_i4:58-651(-)
MLLLVFFAILHGVSRATTYGPFTQLVGTELGLEKLMFTTTVYGAGLVLGSFVWGPLADFAGRSVVVIATALCMLVEYVLLGVVLIYKCYDFRWFLVVSPFVGLGESGCDVMMVSILGTIWPGSSTAFASFNLLGYGMIGVGMVCGPWVPISSYVSASLVLLAPSVAAELAVAYRIRHGTAGAGFNAKPKGERLLISS